ncbi:MAG TPA: tripartite tricarboxylate transporter substrate binding protein [Burkholderiales bacterium]|nr:tripartite tricarboxylate transporter substrate binding protein [Burkholderiales bacterium]
MTKLRVGALALLGMCMAGVAHAQGANDAKDFPTRPIRIMGGGVGSTADFLSRFIGQKLNEKWAQPVVVDSRSGAGGTLAADVVAKAAPDGYNLVMGHAGPMVSAVALYKDLPYDPVKDFAPLSRMTTGVVVLVTHPSVPVINTKELIAFIRQKGNFSYSSAGNGTISHLAGELFNGLAGVKVLHVPYKSAGFALTALLSSETQISFLSPVTAHAQLKAGRVKALAVSSKTRFAGTPEIPSAVEAGIPGMDARLWFGLFTTAKTPRAVVMKLNQEITDVLNKPDVKQMLLTQGAEAAPSTPEELGDFVKSELARWTPIIKAAGIKAD